MLLKKCSLKTSSDIQQDKCKEYLRHLCFMTRICVSGNDLSTTEIYYNYKLFLKIKNLEGIDKF